ncbi:hypothetical protein BFJ63_vAg17939 [Fusarium oxysporum f. sp. narcissi]|uniref:Uncharacterized protein n=2 Tax=Fusarium oxysporum TaxID=5507 RepID=A0A4Q2UZJ8_FUSOX|nr:hypothetical protein BFJ65_g15094 [Fusarium oxysporum f. sp. cepae]RYC79180.1 hypothetical protein BFJ63_vAg17939 [Fusarium oxysporum f. sp. narcissi]
MQPDPDMHDLLRILRDHDFEGNQQPEEPATVVQDPPPIHRGNICISNVIGFIPVFAEGAAIAIYVFFSTSLLPDRAVVAAAAVLGQISPPQALVMGQPRPEGD